MDSELLGKVQMAMLEIAVEIRRVCEENGIPYFLSDGTMLGAVRHRGFIPWDDDMDMGMLRGDYERFCAIAPEKLKPGYCLQTWRTDPAYSLPFAKVRKRNTLYREAKSNLLKENGFYVDVFPFDFAPEGEGGRKALQRKTIAIFRTKLMKTGCRPWADADGTNWGKLIGYVPYRIMALFRSNEELADSYDRLVTAQPEGGAVYGQTGFPRPFYYPLPLFKETADYLFEGETFRGVKDYDRYLTLRYGEYMRLPPEEERGRRHLIMEVDFG